MKKKKGLGDDYLFALNSVQMLTYNAFSKKFKTLILRAGLEGDFASHSLRRGGATFVSMLECPVSQIKDRGGWKSDCVYRYIKPPLHSKIRAERKVAFNIV